MSRFQYWQEAAPINGMRHLVSAWAEGCPMPDCYLDGRPVYLGEVDHSSSEPYESYVTSACYADTDEECSDEACERLTELLAEQLYDDWYQHQVARAERD